MSYSETDARVVAAVTYFCRNCDNLAFSMQYPGGKRCTFLDMRKMVKRHEVGTCGLAMVNGTSGTMTPEGFEPEEKEEATA